MQTRSILEQAIKWTKSELGIEPNIVVSSPGRLDFLNTHQDYKGLPVVSVGVNLRTYVIGSARSDEKVMIASYNMKEEGEEYRDEFYIKDLRLREGKWFGNYLRGAILALRKYGYEVKGVNVGIYSEVPIGGGLGSSAALTVAFIGFLNEIYDLGLSRNDIAELAYIAEHDILDIPCGRLDQYGSAYGGIVRIEVKPPYRVEEIPFKAGSFVVLDSGIKHSTAEIHPKRQADINKGLEILMTLSELPEELRVKLGLRYDEPAWEDIREEEIVPFLEFLPETPARRILYTIRAHRSTELALRIMKGEEIPMEEMLEELGEEWRKDLEEAYKERGIRRQLKLVGIIMNQQHELMRDLYDLSLPELEAIRNATLRAGALGVKISGAGLGGALIALVEDEDKGRTILKSGVEAGAIRGWIVKVDEGLRREL